MPVYAYRCDQCKKYVELFQRVSEKKAPVCDDQNCKNYGTEMESVIGSTSFILKGSGWAKDGYK